MSYANSKGRKVIISVGGYNELAGSTSGYRLDSSSKVDQFMTSRDFQSSWGFNGMDWDLEHGDRPDAAAIIDASQRMNNRVRVYERARRRHPNRWSRGTRN